MTINERQNQVVREFESLHDSLDKYRYLISLARGAPAFADAERVEGNLVPGCQAELWVRGITDRGRIRFEVDSPSLVVKGVAVLLARVLSGEPAAAILGTDLYFIDRIGLAAQLSPTRSNGLYAMLGRMRTFAAAECGAEKERVHREASA